MNYRSLVTFGWSGGGVEGLEAKRAVPRMSGRKEGPGGRLLTELTI